MLTKCCEQFKKEHGTKVEKQEIKVETKIEKIFTDKEKVLQALADSVKAQADSVEKSLRAQADSLKEASWPARAGPYVLGGIALVVALTNQPGSGGGIAGAGSGGRAL
jgi:hypothetical protein